MLFQMRFRTLFTLLRFLIVPAGSASADMRFDFENCYNNCIAPQYYVEDDHEAIIPKEIYMKVQEELVRSRNVQASPSGKKRMYSLHTAFRRW